MRTQGAKAKVYMLHRFLVERGVFEDYVTSSNPDGQRRRWELKPKGMPTVSFRSTTDCLLYLRGAADAVRVLDE